MGNLKPKSKCPECEETLPQSFYRQLNRFWTGVSSAPCPYCSAALQFEPRYGRRAHISGQIFRYSVLTVILLFVARVAAGVQEPVFNVLFGLALIGVLAGILGSATRTVQIQVQRANDA